MLLTRIKLENFKKFEELEREFGPGINVVKGPFNEIGKSTLLDGIVVALFENPRSTRKGLEEYMTWGSGHKYKTAIEFEAEGGKYLLEKDFDMKTVRLAGVDTDREWNTSREVAEKLRELLGTDSRALFLSTSCIRQDKVSEISSGEKEIGESLEEIVTGGAEETVASQVIDKLARQINDLTRGLERPAKSPGKVAQLTGQVNSLQHELAQIRGEVAGVERYKVELVETSDRLGQVELKLGQAKTLLEKNKRLKEIEEKIGKLEKDYDNIDERIRDIESLQKQFQEAGLALQAIEGFDDMQRVLESETRLHELEAERKNANADLPKRRSELEIAREHLKMNRLLEVLASKRSLILGVVVSTAGFLGMALNTASLAAGIIGLIFLIGVMWVRNSATQQKTQISDLQDRIGQMEEALKEVEDKERETLYQVNCGSVEQFRQKEKRHAELVEQKNAFQNQLVGKRGRQTLEQVEQQRQNTVRMLAVERERLTGDLKNTRLSPEEYVRHENEVKSLEYEKERLERGKMKCEVGIEGARFDVEDQTQREEELDSLRNDLNREQKRVKVYELVRDFVSEARTETLVSATDLLQAEIQRNFEIFTNDKYSRVRVDKGSMDFGIYSEEKGDWARPDELSGGVVDEFYLACRLALIRVIYGETQPPLILDDPFTNFDEPRLAGTLEFLSKLSKEHQIIIFTLGKAYDSVADRVIELA